jgi:hypothetical protein
MLKYVVGAVLVIASIAMGSLAALQGREVTPVYASSETLNWHAGNWWFPTGQFCFGSVGWHDPPPGGTATAADIWSDYVAGCGDPDGAADTVNVSTYGNSWYWTYQLSGVAYDGGSLYTYCEDMWVQVKWYNYHTGAWDVLGYEWYKHVVSTVPSSGHTFGINIGAGYWANTTLAIGYTKYPENANCDSNNFHSHQMLYPALNAPYMSTTRNNSLVANTVYQQNSTFIHSWTGWG